MVFVEWLHLRTGDDVYRVLARRWSKVMLALFAVGVVTGTILDFEMGLLWPNFMAMFVDVFEWVSRSRAIFVFVKAIFFRDATSTAGIAVAARTCCRVPSSSAGSPVP